MRDTVSVRAKQLMPVLLIGVVWVSTFSAYQILQTLHRNYCSANLLHAVLFSRSDACVYTAAAIGLIESTSQRVLYAALIAAAYNIWRAIGFLYAGTGTAARDGGGGGGAGADTTAARLMMANATRGSELLPPSPLSTLAPTCRTHPPSSLPCSKSDDDDMRGGPHHRYHHHSSALP